METKHTPEKWGYSPETTMVFSIDENGQADKGICHVNDDKYGLLISKAPEMKEALEEFIDWANRNPLGAGQANWFYERAETLLNSLTHPK